MDALQRYEASERRLIEVCGADVVIRFVDLPAPWSRTRIIESGEGPPVLLVHGGGGTSAGTFIPLLAHLHGVRAIAVDRPGAPHSGAVDYHGVDLRSHAVGFLEATLDALELDSVPFVANSMGGLWTFWLALDRPGRVSAVVQLGCPAMILDTSAPTVMRLLSLPWVGPRLLTVGPQDQSMARRVFRQMGHGRSVDAGRIPSEVWDYMVATSAMPGYAATFASLIRRVMSLAGPRPGMSLDADQLGRLRQPTLFLWGDSDAFGGADVARAAADLVPDALLHVLPEAGHLPWLDDPKGCAGLVSGFLQTHAGTRPRT